MGITLGVLEPFLAHSELYPFKEERTESSQGKPRETWMSAIEINVAPSFLGFNEDGLGAPVVVLPQSTLRIP